MSNPDEMGRLVFDPSVGQFVSLAVNDTVDPTAIDIWEWEYVRLYKLWVKWEATDAPGIGRIIAMGQCASGYIEEMIAKGERVIIIDQEIPNDGDDHYVDLAHMVVRPKAPSTVALKGKSLIGVPQGAEIVIDGEHRYPVKGKPPKVDLSFDQPGTYSVVVESPTQKLAAFKVQKK